MPDITRQVADFALANRAFAGLAGGVLVVAVSGGPDSLALLHILAQLGPEFGFGLHVAHMEHGIRGAESRADAEFVAGVAAEWGLPFSLGEFDVPGYARAHGLSLEDAARRARYAFLGSVAAAVAPAGKPRIVATGHNADDQVETTLLRLLRGAGLRGLAAMRPLARLPQSPRSAALPWPPVGATLIRPLLSTWRRDLEAYCRDRGLDPRYDSSNMDPHYTRNRMRHEVVPLFEEMKPGFKERTWNMAALLGEDEACLESMLNMLWPEPDDYPPEKLPVARLNSLHPSLRRRALLRAAGSLPLGDKLAQKLTAEHIAAALRLAAPDSAPGSRIQWPAGVLVTRDADFLLFSGAGLAVQEEAAPRFSLPAAATRLAVPLPGSLDLERWQLRVSSRRTASAGGLRERQQQVALFDLDELKRLAAGQPLLLRSRRAGEKMRPFGLGGRHRKLQDVFVGAHVPAQWRDRYALLSLPDSAAGPGEVLWIPGIVRSDLAPVGPTTTRVLMVEALPGSG